MMYHIMIFFMFTEILTIEEISGFEIHQFMNVE